MSPAARILAIIPARGGSKGIPGKNIHPVAGKPLIAYSIEQALAAPRVSRVVVSTDVDSIASVAHRFGAEVVHRPGELCGDEASSESALLHCLDQLEEVEGYEHDLVVFLQATSPLRTPADIEGAIATLEHDGADSLFSGCPQHAFVWRAGQTGVAPLNYDPRSRPRRQDAPEDLAENGSIYVFKPWVLRDLNCRLGGCISVHRMASLDSFQVDEPDDIPIVEFLMLSRHPQQAGRRHEP